MTGTVSYHKGMAAEDIVSRDYDRRGLRTGWRRWRGVAGEIDLIAQDGDGVIFIEVKSSRDFARAAERLSRRQMDRIYASASEFLGTLPLGQSTPSRFDVALVDAQGRLEIIENAIGF